MGIFDRIKKGMGLGTITFEIVVPASIAARSGQLDGDVVITAKGPQKVADVEVKFTRIVEWEQFESNYDPITERNEDQWVTKNQTVTLGNFIDRTAFSLAANESKTIHFAIPFPPTTPVSTPKSDNGGLDLLSLATDIALYGDVAPTGPSFQGQRVSYRIEGDADLDDVAFDKGDAKEIAVV